MGKHDRTDFDVARDELMSHVHRCGVLKASPEQQEQWLDDTMQYMAERYSELSKDQIAELHQIGRRFCQPVIARGRDEDAEFERSEDTAQDEMAGVA